MKKQITFQVREEGLPGFVWQNESNNYLAVVLIVHGMVEHIQRYDEFATFLANNNYLVYGYDQRGHGLNVKNNTEVGHFDSKDQFKTLVIDVNEIINIIKEQHPDLPFFILGHSMGSFVTQSLLIEYQPSINGVILSGSNGNPGFIINFGIMISKVIAGIFGKKYRSKFIYNLVFGSYNKKCKHPKGYPNWLSRDPEVVKKYLEDELCGGVCSASFFHNFFKGLKHISKNYHKISPQLSIFILSGTADPVGQYGKGISRLIEDLPTINEDKLTFKLYPEGRHEMLNEINKEEVYNDILTWLNNNS